MKQSALFIALLPLLITPAVYADTAQTSVLDNRAAKGDITQPGGARRLSEDQTAAIRASLNDKPAKNIILLIGDGMGDSEITAARNYAEGAGGFFTDQYFITDFKVLQTRGQRAVLHFDRIKFELFFVIWADDGVGAHQRATLDFQTDHDELTIDKTQARIAGAGEAEQGVIPVVDAGDFLVINIRHIFIQNRNK